MKSIDVERLLLFVGYQTKLALAFAEHYPNAKDLRWLLDFPKHGVLQVEDETWEFVKHGTGIRFVRQNKEPQLVVDMHNHFGEPKTIDHWRILQYIESCGDRLDEAQLSSMLSELCLDGNLVEQDPGQYIVVTP